MVKPLLEEISSLHNTYSTIQLVTEEISEKIYQNTEPLGQKLHDLTLELEKNIKAGFQALANKKYGLGEFFLSFAVGSSHISLCFSPELNLVKKGYSQRWIEVSEINLKTHNYSFFPRDSRILGQGVKIFEKIKSDTRTVLNNLGLEEQLLDEN
jgi:hypothetical protein